MKLTIWVVTLLQLALTARLLLRFARTLDGERIRRAEDGVCVEGKVAVIVPVLNEVDRLEPCLRSLTSHGDRVAEIIVVDGGSTDGTQSLVHSFVARDARVRLVEAGVIPTDWNGKAWGLETGRRSTGSDSAWVVTIDADVRCSDRAIDAVVAFADRRGLRVMSVACEQSAPSHGLSVAHPSLLSTLVYRFGVPGHVASGLSDVQSNGQFAIYRRETLNRIGGFAVARDSICEDVTLARYLYMLGEDVGFFEAPALATTEMYRNASECLSNWPRSLPLRDRLMPHAWLLGLMNLVFLQIMPLAVFAVGVPAIRGQILINGLNRLLLSIRFGILLGTRRAYADATWAYWLSPAFDSVTALLYVWSLVRRQHTWRGRLLVREGGDQRKDALKGAV